MAIEINGMAHVILTVSRFKVAREFYRRLLREFGMKVVFDGDRFFYCVGARTAIGIQPCDPALAGERFVHNFDPDPAVDWRDRRPAWGKRELFIGGLICNSLDLI